MDAKRITAINQLWLRGETDFLLHAGQQKIEDAFNASKYPIFGNECARQFGKSFWGVKKVDQIARKFPGSSNRIGTAFHTDLDAITLPAFEKVLASCPPRLRPRYKVQGGKFVYPNGSEIRLVGLDRNPDKLRGSRLRLVILEEAGFGDSDALRYAYESVIVPAFTHEPDARCVLISTPPEQGADHSFCELVDVAKLHDSYLKLTIYDNPMLTPERIEEIATNLGGKDSIAFRREYLCERIVDTQRAIIPEWKKEYQFTDFEDPMRIYWHNYQGMDIGVQIDKTVVLFGYFNFREQRLYITHELDISGVRTTTKLIEELLRAKEKEVKALDYYRKISDNSHPLLLNDLADKGIYFVQTDKDKIHEMVGEVRVWTQAGRIRVHERCKQLLGCLETGIWDKNRKAFERSKAYGHYDALAALVYLVRNVDVYTNPIPDYAINPDGLPLPWLNRKNDLSPMGRDMNALFGGKRK